MSRPTRCATRDRTSTWVHFARVVCGTMSAILIAVGGYATALVNRVSSSSGTLSTTTEVEGNSDRVGNATDINLLIVGNDSRANYTAEDLQKLSSAAEGGMNTDTIMLIHVPANGGQISVVSFPRDSYVEIPGHGMEKINAAYAFGYLYNAPDTATEDEKAKAGQDLLIATVSGLTGMQIDHYIEVTLLGFYDLTNALGGIEVNLCEAVKDPTGNSGADFPAGPQILNGQQALSFVRQRHGLPNGDLDRIKRQQYFFGAVIRTVLSQGLLDLVNAGKLTGIIDALGGTISYDAALDPLQLADQMSSIAAGNVAFYTMPLAPELYGTAPNGASIVVPADRPVLDAFFASLSAPDVATTPDAPAPTVAPNTVNLDVYNGSGITGAARAAADNLAAAGFVIDNTLTADSSNYDSSIVQYPAGMEAQANTVAAAVEGSMIAPSTNVSKVTLIVGANYPGLPGAANPPATEASPTTPPATAADDTCIN